MAKRIKPSLGAVLDVGLQFLPFFPDFDLHFGSPEAPFWLHFGFIFAPFLLLFEAQDGVPKKHGF